jgi:hypothetical protein
LLQLKISIQNKIAIFAASIAHLPNTIFIKLKTCRLFFTCQPDKRTGRATNERLPL